MKLLDGLNYFEQFLEILSIFQVLESSQDYVLPHKNLLKIYTINKANTRSNACISLLIKIISKKLIYKK
jgi:hypothetical protein